MEILKKEVYSLAKLINAPSQLLPTFDTSEDFARPHIEKQGNEYHFVVVERGQELQRKRTRDLDEILFLIFDGLTFSMAAEIEF